MALGSRSTSTSSSGGVADWRLPQRLPSLLVESSAIDRLPSPVTNPAPKSTVYQLPAATAPKLAAVGPSIAGLVFQVVDSVHEFEVIGCTLPPTAEASTWWSRSLTLTILRPAMPLTGKRMNDCDTGLLSTVSRDDVPKLLEGTDEST